MKNRVIRFIKINFEKDKYWLMLEISFNDVCDKFRMIIDKLSAIHVTATLKLRPFKETKVNRYDYYYSGIAVDETGVKKEYYTYVEIRSGKMRKKIKTKCSKLFCKNILWIEENNNFTEYYKYLTK